VLARSQEGRVTFSGLLDRLPDVSSADRSPVPLQKAHSVISFKSTLGTVPLAMRSELDDRRRGDSWNSGEYHAILWRKVTANGETRREEIDPSKSIMTNANANANSPVRGIDPPSIIEAGFFCAPSKSVGSRNPLGNLVEFLERRRTFVRITNKCLFSHETN
jgi:hypothetical protein